MRTDSPQQFVKLHRDLTTERHSLEARLRQINEALGEMSGSGTAPASPAVSPARTGRGRPPAGGGQSLKAYVIEVLQQNGPMTKEEWTGSFLWAKEVGEPVGEAERGR